MRDRMNPYNFGDGAGAVVVRRERGRGAGSSARDGVPRRQKKPAMQIIGGAPTRPSTSNAAKRLVDLKVESSSPDRFTPLRADGGPDEVLEASGRPAEDIDVCVIPEGNAGYMVEELKEAGLLTPEWTALEGKIYENLTEVGATGSAAVPLALDDAWRKGRLKPGRSRHAARDRDQQVEVRRDGADVDCGRARRAGRGVRTRADRLT